MLPLSTSNYHHGDLRSALLSATAALLDDVGVEALSLREVSRRAGVSHAAAYNHFRDRAALLRAFVDAAFADFAAALFRARDAADDPLDALRRIGIAYVVFAHENRARFKLMFRPELTGLRTPDDPAGSPAFDVLVEGIDAALRAGRIAGDPETLVRASWAIVHGLAALVVDGPTASFPKSSAGIARMTGGVLDVFIEGTRARDPARRRKGSDAAATHERRT